MKIIFLFQLALAFIVHTACGQLASTNCREGDVRLVRGRHYRQGLVQVCRSHEWGRVCDDEWDEKEAEVVCRQLGLSETSASITADTVDNNIERSLDYVLDDLGCNGSEKNLLECLPRHNCGLSSGIDEDAKVTCARKGVTLELGPNQLENNTLITTLDESQPLFCATDELTCCSLETDSNWYLPSGAEITTLMNNRTQGFYILRENQTLGLSLQITSNNEAFEGGIFHCEIKDALNVTNYLYVGIYTQQGGNLTIVSLYYERQNQTIVCISEGGPATTVLWTKDNTIISPLDYSSSQIVTDRIKAIYENRFRIENKTLEKTGMYMCTVSNVRSSVREDLFIQVCRDMEIRTTSIAGVEICADDEWYTIETGIIHSSENNSIILETGISSSIITVTWQILENIEGVSHVIVSCATYSNTDQYTVTSERITGNTNMARIHIIVTGAVYNCCVTIHYRTMGIPVDFTMKNCSQVKVPQRINVEIVLGALLGILSCLLIGLVFGWICSSRQCITRKLKQVKTAQYLSQNGENNLPKDFMLDENVAYYAAVKYSTGGERLEVNENVAYGKCGQKSLEVREQN